MRTYEDYRWMVEDTLQQVVSRLGDVPEGLAKAMNYSLLAGGKRLRPVLLLAACEAGGGTAEAALPYAAALEMIHTYSLIHDDLPAMDNDDERRGVATNHIVHGEAMAILAGDGLLSAAFELMLQDALTRGDLRGTAAAQAIARRCGVTGMVAGQALDMTVQVTDLSQVRETELRKTACLITAAMEAGLLLAGCGEPLVEAGSDYGMQLGLCFQIVDDILDAVGSQAELGKKTGQDAANGKVTWMSLGEEQARLAARVAHDAACDRIRNAFPEEASRFFVRVADEMLHRRS